MTLRRLRGYQPSEPRLSGLDLPCTVIVNDYLARLRKGEDVGPQERMQVMDAMRRFEKEGPEVDSQLILKEIEKRTRYPSIRMVAAKLIRESRKVLERDVAKTMAQARTGAPDPNFTPDPLQDLAIRFNIIRSMNTRPDMIAKFASDLGFALFIDDDSAVRSLAKRYALAAPEQYGKEAAAFVRRIIDDFLSEATSPFRNEDSSVSLLFVESADIAVLCKVLQADVGLRRKAVFIAQEHPNPNVKEYVRRLLLPVLGSF